MFSRLQPNTQKPTKPQVHSCSLGSTCVAYLSVAILLAGCAPNTQATAHTPHAVQKTAGSATLESKTESTSTEPTYRLSTAVTAGVTKAQACSNNGSNPLPPINAAGELILTCNHTLVKGQNLDARVVMEGVQASGVTLDCQGGYIHAATGHSLVIRSTPPETTPSVNMATQATDPTGTLEAWSVPKHITIRNCHIIGSTRIMGLGDNAQAKAVRVSSYRANHTAYTQTQAPSDIEFDHVEFEGTGTIPLYLAPGVHRVHVHDARITGQSVSTAVYFDAESADNLFERNHISTQTQREFIAIDGSAGNRVHNNTFEHPQKGGIYLYRNCGEGGSVRHQMPQRNLIENNRFIYRDNWGLSPSIWLGARTGLLGWRNYCGDDAGYPWGSSVDNQDGANLNYVRHNQWIGRNPRWMVRDWGEGNQVEPRGQD